MVRDLATGEERQLTDGDYDSWHAHGSPDGRSIVFDNERYGQRDIFSLDLATGEWRRLTDHPARDGYPKLSPDGRWVAFHSDRTGRREIFLLDLDDGELTRWTADPPEVAMETSPLSWVSPRAQGSSL